MSPHTETDVIVIGAGMAGTATAAMLGEQGIDTILVDPSTRCAPDFRCEKLEGVQLDLLEQTGLRPAVSAITIESRELWGARYGVVVDRRPNV